MPFVKQPAERQNKQPAPIPCRRSSGDGQIHHIRLSGRTSWRRHSPQMHGSAVATSQRLKPFSSSSAMEFFAQGGGEALHAANAAMSATSAAVQFLNFDHLASYQLRPAWPRPRAGPAACSRAPSHSVTICMTCTRSSTGTRRSARRGPAEQAGLAASARAGSDDAPLPA